MIRNKVRLAVMAYSERTTDIPEHRDLQPKLDWNIRGGPGSQPPAAGRQFAQENLLNYKGDPYSTENIDPRVAYAIPRWACERSPRRSNRG